MMSFKTFPRPANGLRRYSTRDRSRGQSRHAGLSGQAINRSTPLCRTLVLAGGPAYDVFHFVYIFGKNPDW